MECSNDRSEIEHILIIRECYRIRLIVACGVKTYPRDDISHLREADILTIELEEVAIIYFLDFSFSFRQNTSPSIIKIDLPCYLQCV